MGRMYMSYINDGQEGYTWSTLVALTMGAHGRPMTGREISAAVWGSDPPPLQIHQTVNSALKRLLDQGFIVCNPSPKSKGRRTWYVNSLTAKGTQHFKPKPNWKASAYSDSKLFSVAPHYRKAKSLKKVVSIRRGAA